MKKRVDQFYIAGFVAVLFIMSFLFFFLPKSYFSDTENRPLQKVPQFTWDNLWSKKFSEETESFVTDHFPFRDKWVAVKSTMEQLRLQQENNGIYKGHDGYLFEKFGKPDYEVVSKYTEAVKTFAINHPDSKMTFMLAPTSIGVYPERLPWLASAYPQAEVNGFIGEQLKDSLSFMDGFDFLVPAAHDPTQIYFRTDHHWTTYGAYLAYQAYAEKMGWKAKQESEFTIESVTDSFLGSYHTRGQFSRLEGDTIQVYLPKQPTPSEMYIADTDETISGLYDSSYLEKKDKYSYFLGGVHALMTITSQLEPADIEQQKLLVIKDSYAHSVLPFLALHVPEIHVIDLRYYNGNISEYMTANEISDVLMLFNTTTFVDNNGVLKLKQKSHVQ
ncbi:DHHW family protein [Paenibacillus sp. FSL K6-2524]|uniref:DHHW family protein n=1 Tax=Paenibacillus sp. FSL K6-2524 TaxID=2954516 RepID=UPI0030F82E7F